MSEANDEQRYYDDAWEEALNDEGTVTIASGAVLTYSPRGEPSWHCDGCPTMFVYVEHPYELEHEHGGEV